MLLPSPFCYAECRLERYLGVGMVMLQLAMHKQSIK